MLATDARDAPITRVVAGRKFPVLAILPDTRLGIEMANALSERFPGTSVLGIRNGEIIMADSREQGTPVEDRDF